VAAVPCLSQSAQREDNSTTRLFRSLWLYTAIHKLVSPSAAAHTSLPADLQWEWQVAAGRLAAVTPLLVVGTNSYFEGDMVERLKVRVIHDTYRQAQGQALAKTAGA